MSFLNHSILRFCLSIGLLGILSCGLSSCVSKKKFVAANQAIALQDSLRQVRKLEAEALTKDLKALQYQQERLGTSYDSLNEAFDILSFQAKQTQEQYAESLKESQAKLDNKQKILEAFSGELEEREAKVKELNAIIRRQDSLGKLLLSKIEDALVGFNDEELSAVQKEGKVYVSLSDQLLFQSGSANINQKGRQVLINLAEVLNKNPETQILIEGHTDNIPIKTSRYKDNWDLSVFRATTVVRILVWQGKVAPERLIASGRAQYAPLSDNETKEGRKQNRRTEIILTPDIGKILSLLDEE